MGILSVGLRKTKLIPTNGPEQAGFAVKVADNRIWTNIDGIQRPLNLDDAKELAAATTLTAKQSGTRITVNSSSTRIFTLPAAAVGLFFDFFVKQVPGSGAGVTIAPAGTEKVYGKGITAAASKGVINTQATSAIGDAVSLFSDGTDWFAKFTGTWARVS